jgi:hypothetical protein
MFVGLEAGEAAAKEWHGQICDLCTLVIIRSEGGRVAVGAAILLCELCDYQEIGKFGPVWDTPGTTVR